MRRMMVERKEQVLEAQVRRMMGERKEQVLEAQVRGGIRKGSAAPLLPASLERLPSQLAYTWQNTFGNGEQAAHVPLLSNPTPRRSLSRCRLPARPCGRRSGGQQGALRQVCAVLHGAVWHAVEPSVAPSRRRATVRYRIDVDS